MPYLRKDFEGQSQLVDLKITNNSENQMSPNFDLSIHIEFSVLIGENKLPLRMYERVTRSIPKEFPNSKPTIQSRIVLENSLYNKQTSEFDFTSIYDWSRPNPSLKELAVAVQQYFVKNSPFVNKDQKALDQILTNLEQNLVKPLEKFNALDYYNKLS